MSTIDQHELNTPHQKPWTLSIDEAIKVFNTNTEYGINDATVKELLSKYGHNKLGETGGINYGMILFHQLFNAMILVLFISMVVAFGIRDWISAGVIAGVVGINVFIGFFQEVVAEKTMGALRIMSSPSARVNRNGESITIPAEDAVPGDIISVSVGDTIPADLRLIDTVNFETDESMLTGESIPIVKKADITYGEDEIIGVGDRLNMAYSSSIVSKGRATGICVMTGFSTEIGKIARSLQGDKGIVRKVKPSAKTGKKSAKQYGKAWGGTLKDWTGYFLGVSVGTPLQRKLSWLAITLFGIAVVFALVVMGSQRMDVTREVAIYAICVALSMIPSALIVVLSITMATGSKVMMKKRVIVRKLDSVEALGGIDAICSDKTGTLTQGKMVTKKVWIPTDGTYSLEESDNPYNPDMGVLKIQAQAPAQLTKESSSTTMDRKYPASFSKELQTWLTTATLANIASVHHTEEKGWTAQGDATEVAIQVFCSRLGFGRADYVETKGLSSVQEYPFDSSIKRMSSIWKNPNGEMTVYTKGAVERVIELCTKWLPSGASAPVDLDEDSRSEIFANVDALSSLGLRVLAFSSRPFDQSTQNIEDRASIEQGLTFHGLVGIYDPPRLETAQSVKLCHQAGISVHMLTGDHVSTAAAIAREVGIIDENMMNYPVDVVNAMVMVAHEFDSLSDDEIDKLPVLPLVVARCSPQTKVRMIEALHRRGQLCAMTGDGVNDSPSLKLADVGIAMGQNGSDVAKDASDLVLTDDNFASILNAIEEGRRMAANIQKFVLQLLAENVAQAVYLLVGLSFFDDDRVSVFPLSPIEVLWILVITSCFPAMGLGREKASKDTLELPPNRKIFTLSLMTDMIFYGVWMAGCCMAVFTIIVFGKGDGELGSMCNSDKGHRCDLVFEGRAGTFACMTWSSLILAWECIHPTKSLFSLSFSDLWSNQLLFWSIIGGFSSVFPLVYIPVINDKVFLHKNIGYEWGVAVGFTAVYLIGSELWKLGKRLAMPRKKVMDAENAGPLRRFSTVLSFRPSIHSTAKKQ